MTRNSGYGTPNLGLLDLHHDVGVGDYRVRVCDEATTHIGSLALDSCRWCYPAPCVSMVLISASLHPGLVLLGTVISRSLASVSDTRRIVGCRASWRSYANGESSPSGVGRLVGRRSEVLVRVAKLESDSVLQVLGRPRGQRGREVGV